MLESQTLSAYNATMTTTVFLPGQFTFGSIPGFTRQIVALNGHPTDNEFIFDFSRLTFIDGSGMTVISNTMEWLSHRGVRISFRGHQRQFASSIAYLDDCGFFNRHLGSSVRPNATIRNTTLPFTQVAHAEAHGWLEYNFTPFMCAVLDVESGALASIRSCVGEIFNNIQDHSTLNIGFAHVQHYPNMQKVCITVSDFGRGIPNSMRAKRPNLSDSEAVMLATQAGITSQTTPRNRGLGLNLLIERVISNFGEVTIYSFNGAVRCARDSQGTLVQVPLIGNGAYPGTLVDISLPTDQFVGDEFEEEEIEW